MTELNAITLVTDDMARSLDFWLVAGIEVTFGGPDAPFSTVRLGTNYVNLVAGPRSPGFWGRVVIHVPAPDELCRAFASAGYPSETEPADAPWGERYFHIVDPAGHEISFARRLDSEIDSELDPGGEIDHRGGIGRSRSDHPPGHEEREQGMEQR